MQAIHPKKDMSRPLQCLRALVLTALFLCSASPLWATGIKIGAILAETGPAAFLGGPEARSLRMLAERINQEGGINGERIKLIVKDSGGSPEKAISFAKQLIEEEKVLAIIGPSTSGESLAIKKICELGRTVMLSCSAADVIVQPVLPHIFKVAPSDGFAVEHIYTAMQRRGIDKIAVLAANDGFGKAGKEQLAAHAPRFGITILAEEVYDKNATDLAAIVAKLKANTAIQAVVNWSIVPAQSILAKNIRQAGWQIPLYQSHGFANIQYATAAGAAAEGIMFPASRLLVADILPEGPEKSALLAYKTPYESRFNEPVSTFGGHSYDALAILAQAIAKVGSTDRARIREAVEQTTGFHGTAGVFNYSAADHGGLATDAFTMLTVQNGRFVVLDE